MLLSVIIPTLNEAGSIGETIKHLLKEGDKLREIIVADNGSSDNTREIAEKFSTKVKVLHLPEFNGRKFEALNLAAGNARGEILLFLDADTTLPAGFPKLISKVLSDPRVGGGAFEFSFNRQSIVLQLITWLNRFRYRVRQRYYSDQAVFVRKSVFTELGGFPPRLLMETAYLCHKLRRSDYRLKLIRQPAVTSARRFIQKGPLKMFARDLKLWLLDLAGYNIDRFAPAYWEENDQSYG